MITIIAVIAAIAEQKKFIDRSESGFHMIVITAATAELLFFPAIAAITAMVAIIWRPGFREPEKLHISAFCSPP